MNGGGGPRRWFTYVGPPGTGGEGAPSGGGAAGDAAGRALPIHAVAVDMQTTAWVVPAEALPEPGSIAAAPGDLGRALANGDLARLEVQRGQVLMELPAGRTWRAEGPRLRTALLDALTDPGAWEHQDFAGLDDTLVEVAGRVLAGGAGDYIRSHGGVVEVIGSSAGVLDLRMSGMCSACPLSDVTLHRRIEGEIRELEPRLVAVRRVD